MVGTKAGGLKAAATNKKLHGDNFYKNIGKIGGSRGHTGGFASNPERAKIAGAKGGAISSRSKDKKPLEKRRKSWERKNSSLLNILKNIGAN